MRKKQLGGYDCYDGVWAWALSLLGYEFYLATDAALRVQEEQHVVDEGGGGLTPLRECGCAPGLTQREVALALEALEKWTLRTRNLWEALRESSRGRGG
jgi:hypothetical protein